MNLAQLVRDAAARLPDKIALRSARNGDARTFAELETNAARIAAALRSRGVEPGDRVAILMPNAIEFVEAYFGILRAGAVVVPLHVMLTPPEVARIVTDSGAKLVLAAAPLAGVVATADADVVSTDDWAAFLDESEEPVPISGGGDDLAVLAYTSGTTGEAKGAMLTHRNLLANLDQQMAVEDEQVREDDVLFLTLPLFHIFGLNVPLGLLVLNGASGILSERFEPIEALRLIEKHRITVLFGAPPMYAAWIDTPGADQYDLSSVRLAVSGASALPAPVLERFDNLFGVKIYEGYGMTETAPTLTTNRMAEEPRPASIGRPLPGIELRLVGEEGADVELGDPGEIYVRGPNVFKGYWNRDADTEASFAGEWFKTGDVAVQDEEGYLYLVDRKRDLIIVSGFNVYPSEVEAALMEDPVVAEAAVIGEPHPYTGATVKAYVVPVDGATPTEEQIFREVATRLARFKCPSSVDFVEELPRVPTGKVLRRALRSGA
ncbi:MAG: long-chain-fatty-acid--CoA ligase [Actinomycetota bacterium]